jgi:hypothetical protein
MQQVLSIRIYKLEVYNLCTYVYSFGLFFKFTQVYLKLNEITLFK